MENQLSTLLSIRFAPHLERRDLKIHNEGPCPTPCALLEEIPEWAPPQASPTVDRLAPGPVDHYESWQGMSW